MSYLTNAEPFAIAHPGVGRVQPGGGFRVEACVTFACAKDTHSVPVVVTILSGMSRDNLFVALLVGASLLSMMLLGVALLLRW